MLHSAVLSRTTQLSLSLPPLWVRAAELGWSRNRLIRIEIVLAVATFAIMPFNLLAGILGENLVIPDQITGSVSQFWTVNVVAGVACLLVFYAVVMYMRYRRLI